MSTARRISPVTFDEFCLLVKDGQKADLIDGVIYRASPDNTDANDLNAWLLIVMRVFVRRKDLAKVYVSRAAFQLDDANGLEPDIGFVRKKRLHLVKRGRVKGPLHIRPEWLWQKPLPDELEIVQQMLK